MGRRDDFFDDNIDYLSGEDPHNGKLSQSIDKAWWAAGDTLYDTVFNPKKEKRSTARNTWLIIKTTIAIIGVGAVAVVGLLFGVWTGPKIKPVKADPLNEYKVAPSKPKIKLPAYPIAHPPIPTNAGNHYQLSTNPADLWSCRTVTFDDLTKEHPQHSSYVFEHSDIAYDDSDVHYYLYINITLDRKNKTARITFDRDYCRYEDTGNGTYAVSVTQAEAIRTYIDEDYGFSDFQKEMYKTNLHAEATAKLVIGDGSLTGPDGKKVDGSRILYGLTDLVWSGEPFYLYIGNQSTNDACAAVSAPEGIPAMIIYSTDKSEYHLTGLCLYSPEIYHPEDHQYNHWIYQVIYDTDPEQSSAPAQTQPDTPLPTNAPSDAPAVTDPSIPPLLEAGKPILTATGGGTVTANDDGCIFFEPDAGKKVGRITVNGDPIPVPPSGMLTGFTPEDTVEVTFIGEDDPVPTLPPAQYGGIYHNGNGDYNDGGSYPGDGGSGGNDGSSSSGGSGDGSGGNINAPTPPPVPKPSPNISMTRAQFFVLLWAYSGYPEAQYTTNPFKDLSESDYCYQAVLWALELELIEPDESGELQPLRVCTFGELSAIMQRYYRLF